MCGGHSLHKKDWLNLGLAVGSVATGAGAMGMGPLAGLLGGAEGAAGLGAAGLGAAPGEAAGAFVGTASQLPGMGTGVLKGLEAFQKANALMKLAGGGEQQQAQVTAQQPQSPAMSPDLDALYALIYPQRKRKDNGYV